MKANLLSPRFHLIQFLQVFLKSCETYLVYIYLFNASKRNITKWFEIRSKSTIKSPDWRYWRCPGVLIVNFAYISHLLLVFLLLTLSKQNLLAKDLQAENIFCFSITKRKVLRYICWAERKKRNIKNWFSYVYMLFLVFRKSKTYILYLTVICKLQILNHTSDRS